MTLGAFSISLAVKDIAVSKTFYEALGFSVFGGDITQNWLIMHHGEHVIGLFQGMFDQNILTFNPGWNQHGENIDSFTDVREIQRALKDKGIALTSEVEAGTEGLGYFTLVDPDGNQIMFDQHR